MLSLACLLAFPCLNAFANDEAYVIGEQILAQDASISSGKGSVSVSRVTLPLKDYELVRGEVDSLARSGADAADIREAAIALVERFSKTQASDLSDFHSYKSTFFERGECFRETQQSEKWGHIQQYDGQAYIYYRPSSTQNQADIWPTPQAYAKCGLKELNIKIGRFFDNNLLSCEKGSDGHHIQSKTTEESSHIVHLDFDETFTLTHLNCEKDGGSFLEKWFIGHKESNGISIPGVILEVRRLQDTFCISSIVIDDLEVNCDVADEDLWVALPTDTLIVDNREHPPSAYRLADIIESTGITENIDPDALDLDIPESPPAPDPTAPQPAYEGLHPDVEARAAAAGHEEEPETSGYKMIAFALAALGCVLVAAYFLIAIAGKAKRPSGPRSTGKSGAS